MESELKGSCHCGNISFTFKTSTPVPYMKCYCSICRKVQGGSGSNINIMGHYPTLDFKVKEGGELKEYKAVMDIHAPKEKQVLAGNTRYFCGNCSSNLWAYDPKYADWFYPFASSIDSSLPKQKDYPIFHIMMGSKADWVEPDENSEKDKFFGEYPDSSVEDWHKANFHN